MSFENWWDAPVVKEEMKPEPPVNEPVEEGWGVFLAKKADQLGISFPMNMLAERSMKRMEPILKDPRVKQWIDIQSEVLKKEVENFFKQPGRGKAVVSFATAKDLARYEGNGNTGVLDVSGEQGAMPMNKINKNLVFEYQCGKVRLSMLADTKSILRVCVLFLLTFVKEPWRNAIALVPMKPPADDELLKIVGAIENGIIVEEGVISKVKSFLGFKKKEAHKVKPKRDFDATLKVAKAALKKVLAMPEFKAMKPYVAIINNSDDESVFGHIEFKYNLPGIEKDNEKQLDAFIELNNRFFEEMNKIVDDPAYRIDGEDKVDDHTIQLYINDNADITKEAYYGELLARVNGESVELAIESASLPIEEGWIDFFACVFSGLTQNVIDAPMRYLIDKGSENIQKIFDNPEVAKWVDSKAKIAVNEVKKKLQLTYSEKFKISEFKSNLDCENYCDHYKNYGNFNVQKELSTLKQYKSISNFYIISGKHLLVVNGSHDTPYRVTIPFKLECASNKDLNGYCLYVLDAPENNELKKIVGAIESYEPTTEGAGMRWAGKATAAGWGTAIAAALVSIGTFGFALGNKGTWAALLGGILVGNTANSISTSLRKKADAYIEKALTNPEMAAYIRAKAKEILTDMKKQAASMKDGKYVINTNIQPEDLPDDIFHQPFKAPGEETDERIKGADGNTTIKVFSGYEYAEKRVGEYTVAVFYDTNSIKGLYLVVEIKDLNDKFGASWVRARPIPSPSNDELKKMGLK